MTTPKNIPKEIQFRTILVVEEFGSTNSPALRLAQSLALSHHSTLVLVHSIDPVGYAFPLAEPDDPVAREELAHFEKEMDSHHLPTHSATETEVVYQRILQAVRDHQADLIVLGTHVARPLGRLALGAVASELLSKAPCPVLCVPAAEDSATAERKGVGTPVAVAHV